MMSFIVRITRIVFYQSLLALSLIIGSCSQKPTHKPVKPKIAIQNYTIKSGEVLSTLLNRVGILPSTNEKIMKSLSLINFPFKSIRTTDTFKFFYQNDTLIKIEYKKNYANIYLIRLQNDTPSVAMAYINVQTEPKLVKGAISSSLYESMLNQGETAELVSDYADILSWEIDFFTETQTGDSFFVLVEKKYVDSLCVAYGQIKAVRYKGRIGDFYGFYFIDPKGNKDYYDKEGKSLRKAFLKSPLRYSRVSSFFSKRRYHPILRIVRPHHGVDYVAPQGTPVSAIGDGTITFAGWKQGYGRLIEIAHAQRFKSRYGHLSGFGAGIRTGKKVYQGQVIGYVGATGLATGPHLHFEILRNGQWVNPLKIIPPRAEPVKPEYFSLYAQHRDSLTQLLKHQ
ncbi:MAG: peptidoglycan DD-metalloendopeptidase family protein [candidate division WOR-3 bacterium]|nr:peptidoglycan DD-metalloendopeptidase family protein [candidate division WOR-3 bacterium]